jgi:hypothetical protein
MEETTEQTKMTDDDLVIKVMEAMSMFEEDEDVKKTIKSKVLAVRSYLIGSGANIKDNENIDDEVINCMAIGVNDLLNGKPGDVKFSPGFNVLAMHICCTK